VVLWKTEDGENDFPRTVEAGEFQRSEQLSFGRCHPTQELEVNQGTICSEESRYMYWFDREGSRDEASEG